MSYVSVYNLDNPKLPYVMKRKAILQAIFTDNLTLAGELDPYMYKADLHDVLIEEQYTLVIGGEDAVNHINKMLEQLYEDRKEFEDDEDIVEAIDEVVYDYNLYLENFVNMEG